MDMKNNNYIYGRILGLLDNCFDIPNDFINNYLTLPQTYFLFFIQQNKKQVSANKKADDRLAVLLKELAVEDGVAKPVTPVEQGNIHLGMADEKIFLNRSAGESIKAGRNKLKMTQKELSEKIGIPKGNATISFYESDRHFPHKERAEKMRKILGYEYI